MDKSFKTSKQKIKKITEKNKEHSVKLEKTENRIILNKLNSGHFKTANVIYDSDWKPFKNAQWNTGYGYYVGHKRTYSEHDAFPSPVEYDFEPEIEIPERLLPFVKVNLMVKKKPDIEIVGGTVWEGITVREESRLMIYNEDELIYSGYRISNIRQEDIDNPLTFYKYYTSKFNIKKADGSPGGILNGFSIYDIKNKIENAYGVPGENNHCNDSDIPRTDISWHNGLEIYTIDRTTIKGFTESVGGNITGKGIRYQITWTKRDPAKWFWYGNTTVVAIGGIPSHYHKIDTYGETTHSWTTWGYDPVTHQVNTAHRHSVDLTTGIISGQEWTPQYLPEEEHTHLHDGNIQYFYYDLDPIVKTNSGLRSANSSNSNTTFDPLVSAGYYFEESLWQREAWFENTYNSKLATNINTCLYPTLHHPAYIKIQQNLGDFPLLVSDDRNGRNIHSAKTFSWMKIKSAKTKYEKDKFKLYLRGAILIKLPAKKLGTPVSVSTKDNKLTPPSNEGGYELLDENKNEGNKIINRYEANDIDVEIRLQLVLNEPLYWKEIKNIKEME